MYGEMQYSRNIKLDDVDCKNNKWSSCNYTRSTNCVHKEDVLLTCIAGLLIHLYRGFVNSLASRVC